MINLLFIVFILLGSFNLVNLINVLVEQYYSLNRLYKYKLSTIYSLKEYYFGLTIYFISGILLFYFKIYTLMIVLFLLINYFFVIKSNLKNYHFTRRNTLLLLFSGVINGILSFKQKEVAFGIVNIVAFILALICFVCFVLGDKEQFQNTVLRYEGLWERMTLFCMYIPFVYKTIYSFVF